jgi:Fur family transcriptional regulator, iron response regulator
MELDRAARHPGFGLNKRDLGERLRVGGINPTAQRVEIAHLLFQKPQHLSAEEIYNRINSEYERVSQATVYNTLRLFVEKQVVRELIFSSDRIYYDSNTAPHHHFIDVETGEILDLPLTCLSARPVVDHLEEFNVDVSEISILVRGRRSGTGGDGRADSPGS